MKREVLPSSQWFVTKREAVEARHKSTTQLVALRRAALAKIEQDLESLEAWASACCQVVVSQQ